MREVRGLIEQDEMQLGNQLALMLIGRVLREKLDLSADGMPPGMKKLCELLDSSPQDLPPGSFETR